MGKFKCNAKVSSFSVSASGFASEDKSGCKFKLVRTIEPDDYEFSEGVAQIRYEADVGAMDLKLNKQTVRLKLASMVITVDGGDKNREVIRCETTDEFTDAEILFLKKHRGHDVSVEFNPAQREMGYMDEDETTEQAA